MDSNPFVSPPCRPIQDDQFGDFKTIHRKKILISIGIILIILFVLLVVLIPCIYVFVIKPRTTSSSPQSFISFKTSTPTIVATEKPGCVHRQFGIVSADILYSFDCSSAVDDITKTYNGVGAALFNPNINNETLQTLLPDYVTPDYSGQGAALKLNSSIPYQYIQLERSPIFVYQTFTISAWVKPNLPALSFAVLLGQMYKNASTFAVCIIDRRPRIRVYHTFLQTSIQLTNFRWQYVTFTFGQSDLSMAIRIDGLLKGHGGIRNPEYGDFEIEETTIGSAGEFSRYNGLIDQLSIAYRAKNRVDILDEATLVVLYNFEDHNDGNGSLLNDASANSIRATGAHLTRVIGSRRIGQGTLFLNNSSLSYFQSSGFVLLVTHNYTYSYAFWLYIVNASSNIPLIHLVINDETSSVSNNGSTCLAMLIVNKSNQSNNTLQLSLYIYGPQGSTIIPSKIFILQSTWYHIAVVFRTNTFDFYINGTLAGSTTNFSAFTISNEQRLTLTIGNPVNGLIDDHSYSLMCQWDKRQPSSNGIIIGIDNLRFYSRRLKLREIQALASDEHVPSSYFFLDEIEPA